MSATASGIKAKLMVGMEIHVELSTRSKMWTAAPNVAHRDHFEAEPNTLVDPIVIGMPGTLPVMNRDAVEKSIKVGLALNCEIAGFTKWDRKSYYYPDLPKNYQISQYDLPLCGEGYLDVPTSDEPDAPTKRIRILRAHLEEDAGKLMHEAPGGGHIDHSIVDLNRAGTPLLEIVTEPDFESADECVRFAQLLRSICLHLGVSECIMQRGHMRFEPNINVIIERDGETFKTPIAEIKNLNSFKAVHGAIEYEYVRQIDEWMKDNSYVMKAGAKSTRGWDDAKLETTQQREKEDAHDYRYFPDPDLVPLTVSEEQVEQIRATLSELPLAREHRYINELGLKVKDARSLIESPGTSFLFDQTVAAGADPQRAAAVLRNYGAKLANEKGCEISELGITPQHVADIIALADSSKISSNAAADLFNYACESDDSAEQLAEKHGLIQVSDTGELDGFIDQVLADPKNEKTINDIKEGKGKAIGALMGQIMKLSRGKANPKLVTEMIKQKLQG